MTHRARLAPLCSLLLSTAACTTAATTTVVTTGTVSSGCGFAGANTNDHTPGNEPGGVELGLGEVAVAPTGAFVIFKGASSLMVGWPETATVTQLPLQLPTTLAFARQRNVVYVGSAQDGSVHAIDVSHGIDLWSTPVGLKSAFGMLVAASADDSRLLVAGDSHLVVLDTKSGAVVATSDFKSPVIDLAILPDDARAFVVTKESWPGSAVAPTTEVEVIEIAGGQRSSFEVPNCASALAITPDGSRAFLSPSFCNKDPISLLDLTPGKEGWVKNLPGFGPLAIGPGGATAVAFLDVQKLDTTLFDDPSQIPPHAATDPRYYIMTLDTKSLKYQFTVYGKEVPRYQLTPDGSELLVDTPFDATPGSMRIFDTGTRAFRNVSGPTVTLGDFVISGDSKHVYALQNGGLFDIDVAAGVSRSMDTIGFSPTNINASPDAKTLYLRENASTLCIYDVAMKDCREVFTGLMIQHSTKVP